MVGRGHCAALYPTKHRVPVCGQRRAVIPRDLESGGYGSGEVIKGDHPCVPNTSPPPPAVQSARCPQEMELVT